MKKKPTTSPQVRLDPGLFAEIEILMESFKYKMSRPAFIEVLIRAGIPVIKRENNSQPSEPIPICPESAWEKK